MAENKILDNEKLSDEELDQIAGGTYAETARDTKFLYEYGLMDYWRYTSTLAFTWLSDSKIVDAAWAKAGITCCTVPGDNDNNKYWAGGREISRDEAMKIVKSKFPKIRDAVD